MLTIIYVLDDSIIYNSFLLELLNYHKIQNLILEEGIIYSDETDIVNPTIAMCN